MTQTIIDSRYQRQAELLEDRGWNQELLKKAKVAVIGGESLGEYACLTLAAFGFGSISLFGQGEKSGPAADTFQRDKAFDYTKGFLLFEARRNQSVGEA